MRCIRPLVLAAVIAAFLCAATIWPVLGADNSMAAVTEALSHRYGGGTKTTPAAHAKPAAIHRKTPAATHPKLARAVHSKPARATHAEHPTAVHAASHSPAYVRVAVATHTGLPAASHAQSRMASDAPRSGAAHGAAVAEVEAKDTPEATGIWTDLMEGNGRFVAGEPRVRELVSTRQELVEGQHPKVIVLTCSDSRVSPELLFDKNLGELFVVRTAGNVADMIALGSIEYAAEHLQSPVVLILGHDKCGAVAAAASGAKMPTANLEAIVQKISPIIKKLDGLVTGDRLISWAVEANVHQVARDMLQNSPIVSEEVEAGKLAIVKAKYDLATGQVTRLQ
jgi:carbonic anhydrase